MYLLGLIVLVLPSPSHAQDLLDEALVRRNVEKLAASTVYTWFAQIHLTTGGRTKNIGEFDLSYWHLFNNHECIMRTEKDGSLTPVFKMYKYRIGNWDEIRAAQALVGCHVNLSGSFYYTYQPWLKNWTFATDPWDGIQNLIEWNRARYRDAQFAGQIGFYVVMGYYQLFLPAWADTLVMAFQLADTLTADEVNRGQALTEGVFLAIGVARYLPLAKNLVVVVRSRGGQEVVRFTGDDLLNLELKMIEYRNLPGGSLSFKNFAAASMKNGDFIFALKKSYKLDDFRFMTREEVLASPNALARYDKLSNTIKVNPAIEKEWATQAMAIPHELVHAVHYREIFGSAWVASEPIGKFRSGLSEIFAYNRTEQWFTLVEKDAELLAALDRRIMNTGAQKLLCQRRAQENFQKLVEAMECLSRTGGTDLNTAAKELRKMRKYYGNDFEPIMTRIALTFPKPVQDRFVRMVNEWAKLGR